MNDLEQRARAVAATAAAIDAHNRAVESPLALLPVVMAHVKAQAELTDLYRRLHAYSAFDPTPQATLEIQGRLNRAALQETR